MYKCYVAGKFSDSEKIQNIQKDLREIGYTITHDWTTKNTGLSPKECATLDIEGVKQSHLLFVLMDDNQYSYRGTFTEIGCAIGLNKKIIVVCPEERAICRTNCFFHHPSIKHVTDINDGLQIAKSIFDFYGHKQLAHGEMYGC